MLRRWFVRVFDGADNGKEGWVPASILDAQQMDSALYGDRADDAAYRRSLVSENFQSEKSLIITMICLFICSAVVRELIETEEEFGRDLTLVVENYIKTVENSKPPKSITDNKELIFGNFKQIAEFHNT